MKKFTASKVSTPNVIYVDQGQCVITTDPDAILLTTGMTECIGVAFIISGKPPIKAVAHFDGFTLYDSKTAHNNLQSIMSTIQNFRRDFDVQLIAFGGEASRRNFLHLQDAVKKVFGKGTLKYHPYYPEARHGTNPDFLTIASDGSLGTFKEVANKFGLNLTQAELEDMTLSSESAETKGNKLVILTHEKSMAHER